MSRVFVISEALRRDPRTGQWGRAHDLSPAGRYGELVFLLPGGNEAPQDPRACIGLLRRGLRTVTADDYLLPTGNPLYIAWAAAIVADYTQGVINLLHWQPRERCYNVVRADLNLELETHDG